MNVHVPPRDDEGWELVWHESITMARYVAIVIWGGVVAIPQGDAPDGRGLAIAALFGTAAGVAIAHVFAFSLAGHLMAEMRDRRVDGIAAVAQVLAALAVALVVSVPVLVLERSWWNATVLWLLAGIIGGAGYLASKRAGAGSTRAIATGAIALGVAAAVVLTKQALSY